MARRDVAEGGDLVVMSRSGLICEASASNRASADKLAEWFEGARLVGVGLEAETERMVFEFEGGLVFVVNHPFCFDILAPGAIKTKTPAERKGPN